MNFKKYISLFLAFFLLVSNLGIALDVHYCGGKIASIKPVFWKNFESKNTLEESCCYAKSFNFLEENGSCCKYKVVNFEKKLENVIVNSISFQPDFNFLLKEWNPIFYSAFHNFESDKIAFYYCNTNAPPLFKLYQKYIFYA